MQVMEIPLLITTRGIKLVNRNVLIGSRSVIMAVTRARSTQTSSDTENGAGTSLKAKNSVTISKTKVKKPLKATKKPHLEDLLDHIVVPADYQLPEWFVEYHDPNFVKGIKYVLTKDPTLYRVIVQKKFTQFPKLEPVDMSDEAWVLKYWYSLVSSVISQQISGYAAKAIQAKFNLLFEAEPTPKETLSKTTEELRGAGLSNQKVKYIVHISEVLSDPESKLSHAGFYGESSIDELIEELTLLKGIGVWSAKMFAIFTLKNLNVFAYDDLGIARGASKYLLRRPEYLQKIKTEVQSQEDLKQLLKKKSKFEASKGKRDWVPYHDEYVKYVGLDFRPYQLVFMVILWRIGATNVVVLEN